MTQTTGKEIKRVKKPPYEKAAWFFNSTKPLHCPDFSSISLIKACIYLGNLFTTVGLTHTRGAIHVPRKETCHICYIDICTMRPCFSKPVMLKILK